METIGDLVGGVLNIAPVVAESAAQHVEAAHAPLDQGQQRLVAGIVNELGQTLPEVFMAEQMAEQSVQQESEKDRYYIWGHHAGREREFAVLKVTRMPEYCVGEFPCTGVLHQVIAARQVRMSAYESGRLVYVEGSKFAGHYPADGNLRIPGTFYMKPISQDLADGLVAKDSRSWSFIMKQSHRDYMSRRREQRPRA